MGFQTTKDRNCFYFAKNTVVENEDDEPSSNSWDHNDGNSLDGLDSASCSKQSRTKQRKKRVTSFELLELIVRKGIKSRTELLEQKLTGKSDIAEFIVNRVPRVVGFGGVGNNVGNDKRSSKT